VNSPHSGTITELLVNEEDTVSVGQDLFRVEPGEVSSSPPPSEPKSNEEPKEQPKEAEPKTTAAPTPPPQSAPVPKASKPAPAPKPEPTKGKSAPAAGARGETRVKMNRMRVTIANRLKQSQNTAASLTTFNEIDMSA